MDALTERGFRDFMATGVKPVAGTLAIAAIEEKPDPFFVLLVHLCAVGMLAKDLHYRAKGKAFYAIHLLSDLVWDASRLFDDLNEVYFLGDRQVAPPRMSKVSAAAAVLADKGCVCDDPQCDESDRILDCLITRCDLTAGLVEDCKSCAPKGGTQAVLDDISKKVLAAGGLLRRTAMEPSA